MTDTRRWSGPGRSGAAIAAMIVALFVATGLPAAGANGTTDVLYVDDDAPAAGDGATWSTALRFLQDALAIAPEGAEVRVAEGVYLPDEDEANPDGTGDRARSFTFVNGLTMRGGYLGLSAMEGEDPDERDPESTPSTLSGIIGPSRSYHVVRGSDLDLMVTLDGFTVLRGNANGGGFETRGGGARFDESIVMIANCRFLLNTAIASGGGLAVVGGAVTIEACLFDDNNAGDGGGLYTDGADVTVTDTAFLDNIAGGGDGGGAHVRSGSVDLVANGCVFELNRARDRGGGMYVLAATASVTDCGFDANASTDGSAGGLHIWAAADTRLLRCSFAGNSAPDEAGGVRITSGMGLIAECTFDANQSEGSGGAMSIPSPIEIPIVDCAFTANTSEGRGGAIYSDGATGSHHLVVRTSDFRDNRATGSGGGLYAESKSVTLEGCTFERNASLINPGGGCDLRDLDEDEVCRVVGCTFIANTGVGGAGLRQLGRGTIEDCGFDANVATGGAGGGLLVSGEAISILRCTFVDNMTDEDGGGLAVSGAVDVTIAECLVVGNGAADGGGLSSRDSGLAIINTRVLGNAASGSGGGMHLDRPDATIAGSVLSGNVAGARGGGLYIERDRSTSTTIANCSVSLNSAHEGGGIVDSDYRGDTLIASCIAWGNTDDVSDPQAAQLVPGISTSVIGSCIEGWDGSLGGFGNIGDDPLLADPDGPDDVLGTVDDDVRLLPGSPCIDAGANNGVPADATDLDDDADTAERLPLDLDDNPRFADDPGAADVGCGVPVVVDMGAYEATGVSVHPMLVGDVDGDGVVRFQDLLLVLGAWGECAGECCVADLNLNEDVGFEDLLVVLGSWGAGA